MGNMGKIKLDVEVGFKPGKQDKVLSIIPKVFVGTATVGEKEFELSTTLGSQAIIIKDESNGNQFVISFKNFLEALSEQSLI